MKKPDEIELMRRMLNLDEDKYVRDLIDELHEAGKLHYKRAWYLLDKWSLKGWYDYGVTLDLGWLTDEGREALTKFVNEREATP